MELLGKGGIVGTAGVRTRKADATIFGTLVQPMAAPGLEFILGIYNRSVFGPLPMVEFGGIAVET